MAIINLVYGGYNSITEGYYDMITDSFYSDANHTTLITPREGAYYKYIRYTTPVFYKYENGTFKVQKKNATTVTKNTTLSLARSTRRELCAWNGRGQGIVSALTSNYVQLMKRTDVDTVTVNTEKSLISHLYGGFGTKQGTIITGTDSTPRDIYNLTLDYDNNTVSSTNVSAGASYSIQGNVVDNTGGVAYFIENNDNKYVKATINSNGAATSPTQYSTSCPANVCGGSWSNGKILAQGHTITNVGIGTPSANGTSISWTTSTSHNLSGANSLGSDRKGFIAVGQYNSTTLGYSFDQGATWNTMTASQNVGGQIYIDEIGDIWYTSESNTSGVGWIRFGTFLTEGELV